MKKTFLFLLSLILCQYLLAQDLTGKWLGGDSQGNKIEIEIFQDGSKISGFAKFSFSEGMGSALVSFDGTIYGNKVEWTGRKVVEQNIEKEFELCKMHTVLKLRTKDGKMFLAGTKSSIDEKSSCSGLKGRVQYEKVVSYQEDIAKFKDRKIIIADTISVPNSEISLSIFDNMKVDGDIVTLSFNDSIILEKYTLQKEKKELFLKCKPGKNELIVFAESMGTEPPCTAGIIIQSNGQLIKNIVLRSDEKKSESIIIDRK